MTKPQLEFHTPASEWITDPVVAGLSEQIIARDEDSGDYTRLLRFEPGTDSTPNGTLTHDFWEEVFIIEGDLTDLRLGKTFTAGMYACRPPGMPHGPWKSDHGAATVEFRYGARSGTAEYLVIYHGRPVDDHTFISHYEEQHVPLLEQLPNVRAVELSRGRTEDDPYLAVRLRFDNYSHLLTALGSPEMEAVKAHSRHLPPFDGQVHRFRLERS